MLYLFYFLKLQIIMEFYIIYQHHLHLINILIVILQFKYVLFYMPNEVQSYYKNHNQILSMDLTIISHQLILFYFILLQK